MPSLCVYWDLYEIVRSINVVLQLNRSEIHRAFTKFVTHVLEISMAPTCLESISPIQKQCDAIRKAKTEIDLFDKNRFIASKIFGSNTFILN